MIVLAYTKIMSSLYMHVHVHDVHVFNHAVITQRKVRISGKTSSKKVL